MTLNTNKQTKWIGKKYNYVNINIYVTPGGLLVALDLNSVFGTNSKINYSIMCLLKIFIGC